jgi:hypothetical protein
LYVAGGSITLTNDTLSSNNAGGGNGGRGGNAGTGANGVPHGGSGGSGGAGSGGGLYVAAGTVTMTNDTLGSNHAGGGNGGTGGNGPVTGYGFVGNGGSGGNGGAGSGGGLYVVAGTATLNDNTLSKNHAGGGNGGAGGNGVPSGGSGSDGAAFGGGLSNGGGTAALANTIVAGNGADVSGAVTSQGNNLIGATDGSSGWVSSDLTGTSAHPLNPLLAPLGHYGGRTETMALLPGSPAIDAGNDALIPPGVTTDQRGRPRTVNGNVDIGAFESSGFTISVTSGSGQSTGVLAAFPAPLVVTVTANNPIEPVVGGLVRFVPPASGASATLTGSPAIISGSGTASVTATANGSAGSYIVSARARGIKTAARFSLTNTSANAVLDPSGSGALRRAGNGSLKSAGVVGVDSSSSLALSASGSASTSGADSLLAGFTIHQTVASANEAALMSIQAERQPADASPGPFGATNSGAGGGLNGGNGLVCGTSLLGNGNINKLTAEAWAAVDWFFAGLALDFHASSVADL